MLERALIFVMSAMRVRALKVVKWDSAQSVVRSIVPSLDFAAHKGQGGRIGVIGGSVEYTGAPYYAATSALHVGADLSWVFCADTAATAIKAYSPELIVIPCYASADDDEQIASEMVRVVGEWLPRLQGLVIGPGLGRRPGVQEGAARLLTLANAQKIPVVVDADCLYLVSRRPELVRGCGNVILTPNAAEYKRLQGDAADLASLSSSLGVVIIQKGRVDMISDGSVTIGCDETPSPRRCGGLGDILSGAACVLSVWASRKQQGDLEVEGVSAGPRVWAAYAACATARRASAAAFEAKRRSMTAPDALARVGECFEQMVPTIVIDSAADSTSASND